MSNVKYFKLNMTLNQRELKINIERNTIPKIIYIDGFTSIWKNH